MSMLNPVLALGGTAEQSGRREILESRLLAVLRTTPGDLPWRPDFGCDLQSFVGKPLSAGLEDELRWAVQQALARWIPDLVIEELTLETTLLHQPASVSRHGHHPVGRALLFLGTQVGVRIRMKVRDIQGTTTVELDPFA